MQRILIKSSKVQLQRKHVNELISFWKYVQQLLEKIEIVKIEMSAVTTSMSSGMPISGQGRTFLEILGHL